MSEQTEQLSSQEWQRILSIKDETEREREKARHIEGLKNKYTTNVASALMSKDVTMGMREAIDQANVQFQEEFGEPLVSTYGNFGQRGFKPPFPTFSEITPAKPLDVPAPSGFEPTLSEAFSPQVRIGETRKDIETQRQIIEEQPDWDNFKKGLKEIDSSVGDEAIQDETDAIKKAYLKYRIAHPQENAEDSLKGTLKELSQIQSVISGEGDLIDPIKREVGPADPVFRAFSRHRRTGKPVPNLTPAQLEYVGHQYDLLQEQQVKVAQEAADVRASKDVNMLRLSDGTEVPKDIVTSGLPQDLVAMINVAKDDPEAQFVKKGGESQRTEQSIIEEAERKVDQPWFLDPEKRDRYVKDPENFTKREGIFGKRDIFGGTMEGGISWGLRAVMSPFNAVAGAGTIAGDATIGKLASGLSYAILSEEEQKLLDESEKSVGGKKSGLKEKRREQLKKEAPLYVDHPVLANIALNRGFVGEGVAVSDALNLEGATRYSVIAGSFAGDILDPTIGIISGVGRGARVGSQVGRMRGVVKGLKAGGKTGVAAFLDDPNAISFLLRGSGSKKLVRGIKPFRDLKVGDPRNIVIDDIVRNIEKELEAGTLKESVGKFNDKGTEEIVEKVTRRVDGLEDIAKNPSNISSEDALPFDDLKSALGAVVRDDQVALDIIRSLSHAGETTPSIHRMVEALKNGRPESYAKLKRQIIYDVTAEEVFKHTSDMSTNFGDAVAMTERTWANPKEAEDILRTVADDTEIGVIARQLDGTPIEQAPIELARGQSIKEYDTLGLKLEERRKLKALLESDTPDLSAIRESKDRINKLEDALAKQVNERAKVVVETTVWKLNDQQVDQIGRLIDELVDTKAMTVNNGRRLKRNLKGNVISTQDFRSLTDATIDQVASGRKTVIRETDASLLSPAQKRALLQPLETRSFGRTLLKQWVDNSSLISTKNIPSLLTPRQIQLADSVRAEASTLDVKLRKEVAAGLKKPESLGLSEGATKSDIVGALIKRSHLEDSAGRVGIDNRTKETIKWLLDQVFVSKRDTESLFSGIRTKSTSNILNEKGLQLLDDEIISVLNRARPGDFWTPYRRIERRLEEILSDHKNLAPGVKTSSIKPLRQTGARSIPSELQIGAYYFAETYDIVSRSIQGIVKSDIASSLTPVTTQIDKTIYSGVKGYNANDIDEAFNGILPLMFVPDGASSLNSYVHALSDALTQNGNKQLAETLLNAWRDNDRAAISLTAELYHNANSRANVIMRKAGLSEGLTTPEELYRGLKDLTDNTPWAAQQRLLLGEDIAEELMTLASSGKLDKFKPLIDAELKKGGRHAMAVKKFLGMLNKVFYTAVLGLRTRFHGANLLTGPTITYATTGRTGIKNLPESVKILKKGSDLTNPERLRIAVTDKAGRSYTYGELYDRIVMGGGIRSASGAVFQQAQMDDVIRFMEEANLKNIIPKASDKLVEFANTEDMMFRMSIAVDVLKEGRSLDDAVAIARESMFDYNNLSPVEKALRAQYLIFYTFTRQNVTHLIRAMGDPKKFKRYINLLKFDRGGETLAAELGGFKPNDAMFTNEYTAARTLLAKRKGENRDYDIYSPGIPPIDAMVTLMNIASMEFGKEGRTSEVLVGFVHPQIKEGLGIEGFRQLTSRVQPEHVAWINSLTDDPQETADFLSWALGGTVTPVPGKVEDGAIDGYTYPLSSSQEEAYTDILEWVALSGVSTLQKDIMRTWHPEIAFGEGAGVGSSLLFAHGFSGGMATPIKQTRPGGQRVYELNARALEIQRRIKQLEKK